MTPVVAPEVTPVVAPVLTPKVSKMHIYTFKTAVVFPKTAAVFSKTAVVFSETRADLPKAPNCLQNAVL